MSETLFAHLATRFAPSPENIAIEALGFILARSASARASLRALVSVVGLSLPLDLAFATQAASDDLARPDIEGYGTDLKRHVVVECKFWAGLTANQPLTYAARLSSETPGALVFIVPASRMTVLWGELTKRLKAGAYDVGSRKQVQSELWQASFAHGHSFVLASWRAVLTAIERGMEDAHETERLDDVRQLVGLCERMDTEAFLPFRSEELTGTDIPVRALQLGQIAYDVGDALLAAGICDRKGLTTAGGLGYFGRYLRCRDLVFFLAFDCAAWAAHKSSPLWLRFEGAAAPFVLSAARSGGLAGIVEQVVERDRKALLPLDVEPGLERAELVGKLAEQTMGILAGVAALLAGTENREGIEQGTPDEHGTQYFGP
ncbi:MAG: hypothetical protein INR68_08890 [Methylobacterium mesophilicum]|nr:hypothetical protein [Methylobacterium mesophilicum]